VDSRARLVEQINDALPQTQCTRCGFPDCRHYAEAVVDEQAGINQCPPGGADGVKRLARITGTSVIPLNPMHGIEGVLRLARIDEAACIGCTLCLDACPVDCIVGGPKALHTVVHHLCTGCELCLPVCPVDCIAMFEVGQAHTGWQAWSESQATQARTRYAHHQARLSREQDQSEPVSSTGTHQGVPEPAEPNTENAPLADRKQEVIQAAVARAKLRRRS
jgi:Na+-translocating ferredoxin:NAD+ oxidoreductase subunit B